MNAFIAFPIPTSGPQEGLKIQKAPSSSNSNHIKSTLINSCCYLKSVLKVQFLTTFKMSKSNLFLLVVLHASVKVSLAKLDSNETCPQYIMYKIEKNGKNLRLLKDNHSTFLLIFLFLRGRRTYQLYSSWCTMHNIRNIWNHLQHYFHYHFQ